MTASQLNGDEPESDDQGPTFNSPLTSSKHIIKLGDINSESTLMTSPCSSRKTNLSVRTTDTSIRFNDNHQIFEVDCEYTEEQVVQLWFTKDEYDDFLQACDEDAQKCEAHEKQLRVDKLKKEIRKQRRQRRKEEKRLKHLNQSEGLDESMNSMALEMADDIIDDSPEEDEAESSTPVYNEDEEGWLCSLGLEAWTLEGYKTREHHRQKAIDAVLNEQYTAWDRGMVENSEMMSALYFAASATSKHTAAKKARELEEDVREFTVVSTLEDYNKAVQTLNVLQKTLHCIKSRNNGKNGKRRDIRSRANRRGSNESAASSKRRGSNESAASSIGQASFVIDRALAVAEEPQDQAPTLPLKSPSAHPGDASISSSKPRKRRETQPKKIYKSKAETNIIVAPPTPPVMKKRVVAKRNSIPKIGGGVEIPMGTRGSKRPKSPGRYKESAEMSATKSPKTPSRSKKIVYKPILGNQSNGESKTIDTKKKKKRDPNTKESSHNLKKHSPRTERKERRSKSPRPRSLSSSDASKQSTAGKILRKMSPNVKSRKVLSDMPNKTAHSASSGDSTAKTAACVSTSTHTTSSHKKNKPKEHWWFQQQKEQACQ